MKVGRPVPINRCDYGLFLKGGFLDDCRRLTVAYLPGMAKDMVMEVLVENIDDREICTLTMFLNPGLLYDPEYCRELEAAIGEVECTVLEAAADADMDMEALLLLYVDRGVQMGHYDPFPRTEDKYTASFKVKKSDFASWAGACIWREVSSDVVDRPWERALRLRERGFAQQPTCEEAKKAAEEATL